MKVDIAKDHLSWPLERGHVEVFKAGGCHCMASFGG